MRIRDVFLAFSLALAAPAFATTVVAQGVEDLARDATAVIEARVGEQHTLPTELGPSTDTTLQVLAVHAGQAPATLQVRQFGGELDGRRVHIPGDARLVPGQRVLAFVRQVDGRWYFTSLGQSVWQVGEDGQVWRELDGLHLFQRMADGSVRPADQSLPEFEQLPELRAAVRGLPMGEGR